MCKMNGLITSIPALVVCIWIVLRSRAVCEMDTGTIDPNCEADCACCKDRDCGPRGYFPEGNCYIGCIDGYRGGRCNRKCDYPECTECPDSSYRCTKCKAGYYPGSSYNCSSKCPTSCKTCTSSTYCTECIDEYYNANGFNDCRYRYCPLHCKCEHNACVSCESGYYGTSSSCISKCPSACDDCSSQDTCSTCKGGKYNGYEFDITDRLLLNNCTHRCRDNCITCSSYNNCSQCVPGKYGMSCQNECENRICQIEDSKQTAIVVMGVIITLLLLVVISLIAVIAVLKRRSTDKSPKDAGVSFESKTSSSIVGHRRNEDSYSADISKTSEYEKIESIQGQEHEYGHISSAV
ncbi:proprotein convertase subtilisin/kexin type 5-like isoform X2 [Mercenaria mercenaria]|uniref:proprotein convertase subtilisin/kexin type 5-like isoform X2 n=1 Tax=Mercenaria mercenaria TaxID=6596 RepID=UPI00234F52CA|nr:proprotein convertase subtilisin/kexin type 5-like isoform X2 [Mercenaria mercenaria]XP_045163210.2 proprotein convertase subtilisin/kexin type 5-like isoform X2 [Mercenaria mercenaria]